MDITKHFNFNLAKYFLNFGDLQIYNLATPRSEPSVVIATLSLMWSPNKQIKTPKIIFWIRAANWKISESAKLKSDKSPNCSISIPKIELYYHECKNIHLNSIVNKSLENKTIFGYSTNYVPPKNSLNQTRGKKRFLNCDTFRNFLWHCTRLA